MSGETVLSRRDAPRIEKMLRWYEHIGIQLSPAMFRRRNLSGDPANIKIVKVQADAEGDGVYVCGKLGLLFAEWEDTEGDNKFEDLFDAATEITAFANAGSGKVQVTSAGHNRITGNMALISGSDNYNGGFKITRLNDNAFTIIHSWDGDDAAGEVRNGETNIEVLNLSESTFHEKTAITAFSDAGGGKVQVISAGHNLSTGSVSLITESTNYNEKFTITKLDDDAFLITHSWDGDDATGYSKECEKHTLETGALLAAWQITDDEGNVRWVGQVIIPWTFCEEA